MENTIPQHSENNQNSSSDTNITLLNRYVHLSQPHNRISRSTFIINLVPISALSYVISHFPIPFIHLLFLLLYIVQFTKRFHDFGKSGTWTFGVILYEIIVGLGFVWYLGGYLGVMVFALSEITDPTYYYTNMAIFWTLTMIPSFILAIIPGNKEENIYGKPQQF